MQSSPCQKESQTVEGRASQAHLRNSSNNLPYRADCFKKCLLSFPSRPHSPSTSNFAREGGRGLAPTSTGWPEPRQSSVLQAKRGCNSRAAGECPREDLKLCSHLWVQGDRVRKVRVAYRREAGNRMEEPERMQARDLAAFLPRLQPVQPSDRGRRAQVGTPCFHLRRAPRG